MSSGQQPAKQRSKSKGQDGPWAKIAKKPQKTVRLSKNGLTGESEKPLFSDPRGKN